ncbi:hypothetical protein [Burkholderia sp. GbtcB21]|uniref:hypothetical protein n=1 Tax=Burkholderia sp. GbtcB21 TaxID=2824766 RepID=UPI001C30165B|nr:hypothetical protein [Burkholderia sp. GbtcB21]
MPNDNVLTIPRDLLQDLIDDVSDYAASREFKPREKVWRDDVLARAHALLATPQPEPRSEVTDEMVEAAAFAYDTFPCPHGESVGRGPHLGQLRATVQAAIDAASTGASS